MVVVGVVVTPPRVLIVGVPATSGEDRCRRMEGDSGIAMEDVCWDDM